MLVTTNKHPAKSWMLSIICGKASRYVYMCISWSFVRAPATYIGTFAVLITGKEKKEVNILVLKSGSC